MQPITPAYLSEVYDFDPATGTFIIPVIIEQYDDLFNKLDHSPIRRKDLSFDLVTFLEECTNEIPKRYPLEVVIHITAQNAQTAQEKEVIAGIRHYFNYLVNRTRQEIRQKRLRAIKYVLISLAFITTAVLSTPLMTNNVAFEIVNEGLHVGGWVFLWEAFLVNFISMDVNKANVQQAERLCKATIHFTYGSSSNHLH